MRYVTNPYDLRYLTGIVVTEEGETELVMGSSKKYLLTNKLVSDQLRKTHPDYEILDTLKERQSFLKTCKIMECDPDKTTVSQVDALKKLGIKIRYIKETYDKARMIKNEGEIKKITASQRLNEFVLQKLLPQIKRGMSETDIATKILLLQLELGAEGPSFHPIVAFEEGGANPHHTNRSDRKLKRGDQILLDMGVILDGYCSDMTRVIFTDIPTARQSEVYGDLISSAKDCISLGKAGMDMYELHGINRAHLQEKYGEYFLDSMHGVGLEIHEYPYLRVSKKTGHTIQDGMVFTIEPGIYIPDEIGSRFEQIVVVENGRLKNITKSPKKIQITI